MCPMIWCTWPSCCGVRRTRVDVKSAKRKGRTRRVLGRPFRRVWVARPGCRPRRTRLGPHEVKGRPGWHAHDRATSGRGRTRRGQPGRDHNANPRRVRMTWARLTDRPGSAGGYVGEYEGPSRTAPVSVPGALFHVIVYGGTGRADYLGGPSTVRPVATRPRCAWVHEPDLSCNRRTRDRSCTHVTQHMHRSTAFGVPRPAATPASFSGPSYGYGAHGLAGGAVGADGDAGAADGAGYDGGSLRAAAGHPGHDGLRLVQLRRAAPGLASAGHRRRRELERRRWPVALVRVRVVRVFPLPPTRSG